MNSDSEAIIKIALLAILVLAGLLYWIVPRLRISKRIQLTGPLYVATTVAGIISGVIGLVVTFSFPRTVMALHIWELLLMPFALMYFYWAIALKIQRIQDFLDEKQEIDMTRAAGLTLSISILAMTALAVISGDSGLAGLIWLPYYLFVVILAYSACSLVFYKRI